MDALIVVGLIFVVSYLFTRRLFSTRRALLGFRSLFFSGTEFVLVGYMIGPSGFGLLTPTMIDSLEPLIHLALGWAGLMFGLQFNRRGMRLYRRRRWALGFSQALITTIFVGSLSWLILVLLVPSVDFETRLRAAAILGICAGPTAPTSIHYFSTIFEIRGRVNRLLKFIAGIDAVPSVVLLGIAGAMLHVTDPGHAGGLPGWKWLLVGTAIGVLLGLLLSVLVGLRFKPEELFLFVLGVVALASGMAQFLHLPTVFLSFVAGVTAANTAWHREEVHKVTAHAEKPIYLTFLTLTGTHLVLTDSRVLTIAALLLLLRLLGKMLGNTTWRWLSIEPEARSPFLGLALLSQGGMTLVIAMDFFFLYGFDPDRISATSLVVSSVVIAVLANELLSPLFIRGLFSATDPSEATQP
ncbi:MAG: cation:proton antiporter [Acidobacteriota bacterium]